MLAALYAREAWPVENRRRGAKGMIQRQNTVILLTFYFQLQTLCLTMRPSQSGIFPVAKVALFITAKSPFSDDVIACICRRAELASEASPDDDPIRLTLISGNFAGWTPLQLARNYVMSNFTPDNSPFACLSFVILDEKSYYDKQVRRFASSPSARNALRNKQRYHWRSRRP